MVGERGEVICVVACVSAYILADVLCVAKAESDWDRAGGWILNKACC